MLFNPQYPIPAVSSRTQMRFLKQQLPSDVFLPHSLALSFLSGSVVLTHALSLTHADRVRALTLPPPSSPPPPALTFTPLFTEESHGKEKGWMMCIPGWMSDVERDTAVIYHLRDTHILTPSCHTDTLSQANGDSSKIRGLTKSLAIFFTRYRL